MFPSKGASLDARGDFEDKVGENGETAEDGACWASASASEESQEGRDLPAFNSKEGESHSMGN